MKKAIKREKALKLCNEMLSRLDRVFKEVIVAGSIRRNEAIVNDIDIMVRLNGSTLIPSFQKAIPEAKLLDGGKKRANFEFKGTEINVYAFKARGRGAMLMFLTGPKLYNVFYRARAKRMGFKLNQYGLWRDGKMIAGKTEESIYKALGKDYKAPELRGK